MRRFSNSLFNFDEPLGWLRVKLDKLSRFLKIGFTSLIFSFLAGCGGDENGDENVATKIALDPNEPISYSIQVKPILSDRCFGCHGQDEANRKADLQLHNAESAYKKFKDGSQPIVPGNAEKSVVYQRIISTDPDFVMPPKSSHTVVTPEEAEIIKVWINQGAKYEKHWAYIPPKLPKVPANDKDDQYQVWPSNSIDNFTLAKMVQHGLTPAEKADKAKLIRRAFLDITGVIPSPTLFDKYMADKSENAYEKMLNDLFASERYGEKMASYWLELARYGDTDGYQNDGERNMWPWRNWVIDAFNHNMPFDQFMIEQLAGDLLENSTKDQILATGFNRNTPLNAEGGIIDEEFRVEYIADKVDVTSTTFLAHTMGCARCHDHKYDPLSAKDYYKMFAFFNNTRETGISAGSWAKPNTFYYPDKQDSELAAYIEKEIAQLEAKVSKVEKAHKADISAKLKQQAKAAIDRSNADKYKNLVAKGKNYISFESRFGKDPDKVSIANTAVVPGKFGNALRFNGQGKYSGFANSRVRPKVFNKKPLGLSIWTRQATAQDLKVFDDLPTYIDEQPLSTKSLANLPTSGFRLAAEYQKNTKKKKGFDLAINANNQLEFAIVGDWPKHAIKVVSEVLPKNTDWQHIYAQYDGSEQAKGLSLYLNGKKLKSQIVQDNLEGESTAIRFGDIEFGAPRLAESGLYTGRDLDEFRLLDKVLTAKEIQLLATSSPWQIAGGQFKEYPSEYLADNQQYIQDKTQLLKTQEKLQRLIDDRAVQIMVMQDAAPFDKPIRATYLLDRGSYDKPVKEEALTANIPSYFGDLTGNYPQNRLGLAKWLASDENPLTARVMVNRLWQLVFGRGIVNTSENFGNQGDLPTHPKLLDWLAIEFKQSGWDIKYMLKLMMMSSTYQQSSDFPIADVIPDPENIYLSRGGRYRMTAEQIRDSALQASGLLVNTIGGPSVKPYQPANFWQSINAKVAYKEDTGDGLYRRGLYSYWKRTAGVPSMIIFDAATKDYCVSRRQSTNTPLQALVMFNDPQYVEASRALAEKAYSQFTSPVERIDYIARSLLNRSLESSELAELTSLLDEMLVGYQAEPEQAKQLFSVGAKQAAVDEASFAEVAAYAVVSSAVMNLSEFITRQ
ncbi:hypothetical protein C2869_03705 [Saccharobesus litoralis]|uniref:Planctomycete cytochrome C n=1 Tax=Saccharobesus litoralis TaxID=2172099 RepID=A0A2S0VN00_9ALTE|nr:DUF1553 domain-containing protein [Saccharobesus litoralis]AWB65594.1 hypothetical protein C2869_03705 [Saccharobesus litoralis]